MHWKPDRGGALLQLSGHGVILRFISRAAEAAS